MKVRRMLFAVLMCAAANACNSPYQPADPDPTPVVVPVTAVKVTPQTLQLPAVGDTSRLVVAVGPANATDKAVTWESTDSAVATVDANGLVTAKAVGAAVFITAVTHDGHLQASSNITVGP